MVIVGMKDKNGKALLVIGLSREALKRLETPDNFVAANDKTHGKSLGKIGVAEVIVVGISTEQDMIAKLQALWPEADSWIHPDLYS